MLTIITSAQLKANAAVVGYGCLSYMVRKTFYVVKFKRNLIELPHL